MDPISFWMQGTLFWVRIFKHQQEAYLRMLGQFAGALPHESCDDLAREAEAVKSVLTPTAGSVNFMPRPSAAANITKKVKLASA
ncbi:MAG: hypothetical protein ACXIU7_05185 [Roseinatronobacter sp.]|jgi:hypothetical protein